MTVPLPENRSQSTLQALSERAALPGSRKAGCPRPPTPAAPRPCALSEGKVAARLCLIDGGGEPEANATDKLLRPQFVYSTNWVTKENKDQQQTPRSRQKQHSDPLRKEAPPGGM